MSYDVQEYCRTCGSCQRNKPSQQKPIGLLRPLPIPSRCWESIGIDFVTGLPVTPEGYSVLMTVVDRLSKFMVLIPTVATFDAPTVAKLFMNEVVKRFGFPLSIVSDRDPRFISLFWKQLTTLAGVKRKMSSAAHPQTDGVTEQANRTIAAMARTYIDHSPRDWAQRLPTLEIAYNDSVNASTGYSPYFLCSGTNPILPLSLYAAPTFRTAQTVDKSVQEYIGRMRADVAFARVAMAEAQARQQKYANKSRRHIVFEVGDLVFLSEHHFKETTGSNLAQADGATKKLNALYRGPFKITEVISDVSYRLELPAYMVNHTHNAFHVSRLKPYLTTNAFPARKAREGAEVIQKEMDGDHYEIIKFCGHRLTGKGGQYLQVLVQYKGHAHEKEWQFSEDLCEPPGLDVAYYFELLSKYAASNPRGSGPKGRVPNKDQIQLMKERLRDELKRAELAVKKEKVKKKPVFRQDTERTEGFTPNPKPKKAKHDVSVGDAVSKGGRERAHQQSRHKPALTERVQPRSTRAARHLSTFGKTKTVDATPQSTDGPTTAAPQPGTANKATRRSPRSLKTSDGTADATATPNAGARNARRKA